MIKTGIGADLGRRVRKLRKERHLSQQDLADRIEMSIDTLERIAHVFGLQVCDLFQFQAISTTDKEKITAFDEIYELLKNEHIDIFHFTRAQIRFIIEMKESFINRLRG